MSELYKISSVFNAKIDSVKTKDDLQNIKTEFFGKNGQITQQFKSLGSLDSDKRKEFASNLNKIKDDLTHQLEQKNIEIESIEINEKLKNEKVDVTLPVRPVRQGKIHPVSQVIDEISSIFSEIGFSVAEGPDVESEYNNFTALNTPQEHPARDMHDTFYLEENKKLLLRTHTSPVQIRTMLSSKPPFKIIVPGRTYRCDSDQTHAPMFHQLEGLHIDKGITMGHLKGCLDYFIKEFFEVEKIKMRFRPSHFPFTEPSAEVDIGYKIEKGKVGKLFKENLVKQLDSIYKNDSIVRRIGEGDYIFSGDDKYLIFNNKKEHLLTLTPRNQHDTSEPIETIEIISDLFKTNSGISVNSTFGEIDKNHNINGIQNTINNLIGQYNKT